MTSSASIAEAATRDSGRPVAVHLPHDPERVGARSHRRTRASVTRRALLAAGLALAVTAWQARTVPLRALGAALVHEDGVAQAADVAVVSMAGPRGAALEAAKLYRRGLVREVWVPRWREEPVDRRVDALGVRVPRHHQVARAILERAGVPSSAIVELDEPVSGLESEMAAVGRALRARPTVQPIVLPPRSHTARARFLLGEIYAPASRVRVHAPRTDRFAPEAWWRDRSSIREVLLEYLKWASLLTSGPHGR